MTKLKFLYVLFFIDKLNIQSINQYILNFQARLLTDGFNIEFDFDRCDLKQGLLRFEIEENNLKIIEISNQNTHINFFLNLNDYKLETDKFTQVFIIYNDYSQDYNISNFHIRHIDKLDINLENQMSYEYPMLIKDNIVYVKKQFELVNNKVFFPNDLKCLNSNILKLDKYVQEDLSYTSFYLNINQAHYELKKVINENILYLNLPTNKLQIEDEIENSNLEVIYNHKYSYSLKFSIDLSTYNYLQGNDSIYTYNCEVKNV